MPVEAVAERKEKLYFALLPQLKPVPEVLEHIDAQYGRIPFAVVSGSTRESVVNSLTAVGLLDRFEPSSAPRTTRAASPRPMHFSSPPSGSASRPKIALSLKTPTWASRRQPRPAWPRCAFPRRSNVAMEPRAACGTSVTAERRLLQAARTWPRPHLSSRRTSRIKLDAAEPPAADGRDPARPSPPPSRCFTSLTNGRYGFHRDELQFLSDARHLDWGFVAYPPFTPFRRAHRPGLFGLSMVGLRLFSVLAQAAAIVVAGLMAQRTGRRRVWRRSPRRSPSRFSPLPLFEGTEFQYTSFDFLWWVLIAYFTVRLLKTENPRWWLAIGAAVGLGLLTKYAIVFYIAGILAGLVFTPARRYFASRWFWAGVALALLIFLPNLVWLVRHDFISYHFLQHIHARDVGEGRADGFLKGQFLVCANLAAAPLWLAGLIGFLRNRRYRMLAWMYLVPLALFFVGKGRDYYMAGAYPMLLAMGAVDGRALARCSAALGPAHRRSVYFAGLRRCRGLHLRRQSCRSRPAARCALCARAQRRPARRDRLGRTGAHRRRHPRFAAARPAGASRHHRRQLRRIRRHRNPRPRLRPSRAHQHHQLRMAARLSIAAAHHAHRARPQSRTGRRTSSPAAASPATTATPKACATKRA